MEEILKKLAENFGFVAPFGYAGLAYGFFRWLDENASDEVKAALARTMRLKDYKNEQVASALVEVFDRIYTYPLLSAEAFFRSFLFTTVVSQIWLFEWRERLLSYIGNVMFLEGLLAFLIFNVVTDYLVLFVIRPVLIRSGTRPVIGLTLGALSGIAIALVAYLLRKLPLRFLYIVHYGVPEHEHLLEGWFYEVVYDFLVDRRALIIILPAALIVFAWLPLFALGILMARLLTPLTWVVGRTQWFLKEGKEHPLKAIGYVAAVVVFVGTVAGRAVFSAV
jgi:hypothetical protein